MPITRRQFTQSSAAALAATAFAGPLSRRLFAQGPSPIEWRRINDNARAIEGLGGNALVFADGGEALLVDTKVAVGGELTRGLIESADYNVTRVVNTHHHADHTGGNAHWTRDTPLTAHANASPRIAQQFDRYEQSLQRRDPSAKSPPIASYAPTETIEGDTEIKIGDATVEIHHFGPGHTDNDLAIFIPSENILHTGDLCFHKMHIFVDLNGGVSTKGWHASVEELIKLCDENTVVVPGHGPVTNIRGLETQRDYIRDLRETVAKAIKEGKTREQTYRLPMPGTENYASPRLLPAALAAIYVEMTGETPG